MQDSFHQTEPEGVEVTAREAWHTPGPWEWEHFTNERGMCLRIGGLTIEGIDNCYVSCHQADQWLMKATPDLLASLQLLIEAPTFEAYREKARAAIAAATGSAK